MSKRVIMIDLFMFILLYTQTESLHYPEPRSLSPAQIERLASWTEGDQNMWELSGQTEGDMVLLPQQKNGLTDKMYRWHGNVIPYELSTVFTKEQASIIHEAVKEFRAKSSLTVRPRQSTDLDYVYVTAENTGCWANVGKLGGKQSLNLQINGCLTRQIIIHEFLHVAGFVHQHSATERDYYIDIIWGNIQSGQEHNFDKYERNIITNYGTPYDYGSIMHYSEDAFSVNGQATIVPHNASWIGKLGSAEKMSDIDVEKLRKMYPEEDSNSLWMYIGIAIGVILFIVIVGAICSWLCCLSYCLTCCCCCDCCSCLMNA